MLQLPQGCQQLGLDLSVRQLALFEDYLNLLERWNRAYNLTAIRDRDQMVTRHFLDSLAVAPFLDGQRLLDVGTGAGFPGVPLAIAEPEREFVLLDSNGKKTRFLRHLVAELSLANVHIIQQRAEVLVDQSGFDMILSRAFAALSDMVAATIHLLSSDGRWLAMKGIRPLEEISALPASIELQMVESLEIPGLNADRHIVIMHRSSPQH